MTAEAPDVDSLWCVTSRLGDCDDPVAAADGVDNLVADGYRADAQPLA